ncbi:hypothetical protein [Paenibacillus timonensis]|uniref:hypothetical protein n=1 Tax=Paenibacillus timonensis TaxID=225915 RepID=UPI003F9D3F71
MKKRFLLWMSFLLTLLIIPTSAFAEDNVSLQKLNNRSIDLLSLNKLNFLKSEIAELKDSEFDSFVVNYLRNNTDREQTITNLSKLGVTLTINSSQKIQPFLVEAYDSEILAYSAKRIGDSYYRLYADYGFVSDTEDNPASYDVVGIYWDKNAAKYYSYSNSNSDHNSLRSGQRTGDGLALFNAYDSKMYLNSINDYWVAVYVTPTASTGEIAFGADWTHTYDIKSTSSTGQASINFGGTGIVGGSIGYSVTTTTTERSWEIADTNAIIR